MRGLVGQHPLDVGRVDVDAALEGLGVKARDGLRQHLLQRLPERLRRKQARITNGGVSIENELFFGELY